MTNELPIPSPQDEQLWRTCLHEAGHAWVIHWMLGFLGVVSVRPGVGHAGVVTRDPSDPPLTIGHPLYGVSDPLNRQRADRTLVMFMIGAEAERLDLHAPLGGFARPAPPEGPLPDPVVTLSPQVAAAFAAVEAEPYDPKRHDRRQAFELAKEMVGEGTADLYVGWARAYAWEVAQDHAQEIHQLASALWREPVIAGREAGAILDDAHERSNQ